ncbi:MAG: tetratricopeptide repeat protein [Deltaproteobacteria bacterium]|nr:tetratricopeptide repeat protein [Deltaproteobacteria bacterium]
MFLQNINYDKIFLKSFRPYLWIIGLGFLLYFQALGLGYVSLDDEHLIVQNYPHISNLANLPQAFLKDVYWRNPGTYYRPLLNVSLMLDAAWGGTKPFAYHFTNILLHLACGLLIFAFFQKIGFGRGRSFVVSLFYIAHPALVQATAWIPGRNDTLLTLLILAGFIFLIRYLEKHRFCDIFGHFTFFALACLTKEAAVVFPLAGLLYVWAVSKEIPSFKKLLPLISGWVVILAGWYGLRWQAISPAVNAHEIQFANFKEILTGLVSYTGKVFFPFNLSVLPLAGDVKLFWGLMAIALVLALALVKGIHHRKLFFFGLSWYLLFLLPTFVKLAGQINYLEHRLYLPLIGLVVMLLETNVVRKITLKPALMAGLPVLVVFGLLATRHIADFKSDQTFWGNATQTSPNSGLAHQMLGRAWVRDLQPAKAEQKFIRAAQLDQKEPSIPNDLGLLYLDYGKFQKSKEQFQKVLEIDPNYANVRNNLALVYFNLGMLDSSRHQLQEAIRLDPSAPQPYDNLGVIFMQSGRLDSAGHYFNRSLSLSPADSAARQHLFQLQQLRGTR